MGYTDIQELDVPPCVPIEAFNGANCAVSSNTPSKYVLACPVQQTTQAFTSSTQAAETIPAPSIAPAAGHALVIGGGIAAASLLAFLAFR